MMLCWHRMNQTPSNIMMHNFKKISSHADTVLEFPKYNVLLTAVLNLSLSFAQEENL